MFVVDGSAFCTARSQEVIGARHQIVQCRNTCVGFAMGKGKGRTDPQHSCGGPHDFPPLVPPTTDTLVSAQVSALTPVLSRPLAELSRVLVAPHREAERFSVTVRFAVAYCSTLEFTDAAVGSSTIPVPQRAVEPQHNCVSLMLALAIVVSSGWLRPRVRRPNEEVLIAIAEEQESDTVPEAGEQAAQPPSSQWQQFGPRYSTEQLSRLFVLLQRPLRSCQCQPFSALR